MRKWLMALTLGVATATSGLAGPVADFKAEFRQMYGLYRHALFRTNAGELVPSAQAMAGFAGAWDKMAARYADTPPPQFEDDPAWRETVTGVTTLIAAARAQVEGGDLAQAHETLEGVREAFGALHARNGIETFSDRMNAYHSEMEHLLALDPAAIAASDLPALREQAAVLAYLADEVIRRPPADAAGSARFVELIAGFGASVAEFREATRAGDLAAVRAAIKGLKKPYAMLFLTFG